MDALQQLTFFIGSVLDGTLYFLLYFVGSALLATGFWYFWQKQDKEEIEKLQGTLNKLQPQYDVLNNQHEHLKAEHVKVKQGLSDLMQNYQSLTAKHDSQLATQSTAKDVYVQADEERLSLLDSYESLETNYNELDNKYNNVVTTLDRLEEETETVKTNNSELQLVNKHLRAEIKKLEEVLEENGEEVTNIRTQFQSGSTAEDDEIEKLIGASKAQGITGASKNEVELNEEIKEIGSISKVNYDALKAEYDQLQEAYEKLNVQQKAINAKNDNPETANEFESLKDEHSSLLDNYVSLKGEMDNRVLPQLRATQTLLNKKEETYRQLKIKMEAQHTDIQNSSNQKKNFEDLRATNQALYTSNKKLTEKNSILEKKYEKIKGEHTILNSQFQLLRGQLGQVEDQKANRVNKEEESEFSQLSKEYSQLKIQYLAATDQQKIQQNRLAELEGLLDAINESSSYGIIYLPSNLQIVEGINSKVETQLNKAKIHTWSDLAVTSTAHLQSILKKGGTKFKSIDPSTWAQQAQLLMNGKWKAFKDLEAALLANKKRKDNTNAFDDLKKIEGIGPKIEVLLNNAHIKTWKKLSKTGIGELKRILKAAGSRYQIHDPSSWPEQAELATIGNWIALEKLQEELKGGRLPSK